MSYRAGVSDGVARMLNIEAGGPRLTCDGCGFVLDLSGKLMAPAWLLKRRAPPKWAMLRTESEDGRVTRRDHCPKCVADAKARSGQHHAGSKGE